MILQPSLLKLEMLTKRFITVNFFKGSLLTSRVLISLPFSIGFMFILFNAAWFPGILPTYKMPTIHFAYRHFAYQTLCLPDKLPTDIVPTRQSAYRILCLPDILPNDILHTRHNAYPTFCLLLKIKLLKNHSNSYKISYKF